MKKLNILLVEDDEVQIIVLKESLNSLKMISQLSVVRNGELALKFLRNESPYENSPFIDLILMDINMPVMDGFETLKAIKDDDQLKHIPVIMLTTSSRKEDITKSYQEYASSYIIKPNDILKVEEAFQVIKDYWENTVKLPPRDDK